MDANGHKLISDYGAIGGLRSLAPVGRDGSIDWGCFPHPDRDSLFTALLAAGREVEELDLLEWMERVSEGEEDGGLPLQNMYGLHGETELTERDVPLLCGVPAGRHGADEGGCIVIRNKEPGLLIGYRAPREQSARLRLLEQVRRVEAAGFRVGMCSDHFHEERAVEKGLHQWSSNAPDYQVPGKLHSRQGPPPFRSSEAGA